MHRPHLKHHSVQKRSRLAGGISVVGLIGVLATLLFSGSLFWLSAPKTEEQKTPVIASSEVPLTHKRIQDIQPGQWVKADNPAEEDDTEFGKDVNPAAWKLLKLKAPKLDGTLADVSLLRPDYWLTLQSATVGGTVYISVPECGIDGNAKVLAIEDCPLISPSPGPGFQIVTGTFQHQAAKILDIGVESESKPIGTTPNHPFWSVDRQAFVRADSLTIGERLQNLNGITTVTSITPRGPPEPVFNLEVQVKHTYYVADSGVLVHNAKDCLNTSTVNRIEGGVSRERFLIDEAGNVTITRPRGRHRNGVNISVSFDDTARQASLAVRESRTGAVIKSFDIDKKFADKVRRIAIPEQPGGRKKFPGVPFIVDKKFKDAFQIPPEMFDELQEAIIQGSGRIINAGG